MNDAISLDIMPPGTPPAILDNGVWIFDDVLFPSSNPIVDHWGLLFTDSLGNTMNLYTTGSTYCLSAANPGGGYYNPGDVGIVTPLFAGGLGLIAMVSRRRKRSVQMA